MLASEPQSEVEPANADEAADEVADDVIIVATKDGKAIPINVLDDRKLKELRTLKQHYYPEGGWGWLISVITLLVQMISVGFPFGLAMFVLDLPQTGIMSRKIEEGMRDYAGRSSIIHQVSLVKYVGSSATRFGKISPLWLNFKSLCAIFGYGLISICSNFVNLFCYWVNFHFL